MTADTGNEVQKDENKTAGPRKRSRARRMGAWTLFSLSVLVIGLCVMVLVLIGQTLTAPDWLRDRIESRIEKNLGGLQISFGDMELIVNKGWRPRVLLRDVDLVAADGQPIVHLADAEASLAMRPLLDGQVQPKSISLSGAFATLRRDASGNLTLSLGDGTAPIESAAGLPQLIEEWDQLLLAPALSALVSVQMEALTLRYEDVPSGRAWTLDGGRIQLDREDDQLRFSSVFSLLSGGDYASLIEMNYASRIGDTKADFGIVVEDISAQDISAQNVALSWLDVIRAPISGALRGSVDAEGALGPLSATLQIGAGVLQPTDDIRPIPFNGARSYFTYTPDKQMLVFDELSVSSGWGEGSAEGRAYFGGVEAGKLTDLVGQFTLSNVSVNPDGLYDQPLDLSQATADFRLELDPFRLDLGELHVTEQQTELLASGDLSATEAGWVLGLDAKLDVITPERLVSLWPEKAAPKPRKWVQNNLSGGELFDIDFALRAVPGDRPDIYLDFDFDDANIRFLPTMPPITKAQGSTSLNDGRFVVAATGGHLMPDQGGPIDISGTSFIIPEIRIKKAAPAVVRMIGSGSVTAVMSLLNRPPLQVLKGTPLPVDLADGQATITGTLALPLKDKVRFDEFEFHLNGSVADVSSTVLVPGYTVTSPSLEVQGDQTQITLSGTGKIGPVPATVRWRQPLGKGAGKNSQLTGQIELSSQLIETFGIGLPKDSVTGQGSGDFVLDLGPGAPPALAMKSDLEGVILSLPPLGWAKPAATKGLFELVGTLGEQARVDRLILQAAGLSATGTVVNRPGGGLDRALLSSVRLDGWLDANVELIGRGDGPPDMRILSGTVDMRKSSFESDSGSSAGNTSQTGVLQASLSRLQVTDTIALTDFEGTFKTSGGLDGSFGGKINGQTRVVGQIVPQDGRSAVRIQSENAGGVFRSSGLFSKAEGGNFDLTLLPVPEPGEFDGTLRVTNTRVKNAPVMAALLNAVSVIGLLDEMTGQGILFTELDGKFRLAPSKVTVYSSSATGPSIGISMDGTYDVPTGSLRMQGAISPVYLLNSIGSLLTRKGEGVIGFNYTLSGPADSPDVEVNPLSALAPGMLRDILRTSPPPTDGSEPPVRKPQQSPPGFNDDPSSGR